MDYGLAVQVLFQQERRAGKAGVDGSSMDVPAGTPENLARSRT
jgi:hypothetical protein